MSALNQLWAPDVLPDTDSDAYQAVLAIMEDHPITGAMDHNVRASLAQRCVDATNEHAYPDEIVEARGEAYAVYKEILDRPKLPAAVRENVPGWARARYAGEELIRAARANATQGGAK